jgi:hypothetical protein
VEAGLSDPRVDSKHEPADDSPPRPLSRDEMQVRDELRRIRARGQRAEQRPKRPRRRRSTWRERVDRVKALLREAERMPPTVLDGPTSDLGKRLWSKEWIQAGRELERERRASAE